MRDCVAQSSSHETFFDCGFGKRHPCILQIRLVPIAASGGPRRVVAFKPGLLYSATLGTDVVSWLNPNGVPSQSRNIHFIPRFAYWTADNPVANIVTLPDKDIVAPHRYCGRLLVSATVRVLEAERNAANNRPRNRPPGNRPRFARLLIFPCNRGKTILECRPASERYKSPAPPTDGCTGFYLM